MKVKGIKLNSIRIKLVAALVLKDKINKFKTN